MARQRSPYEDLPPEFQPGMGMLPSPQPTAGPPVPSPPPTKRPKGRRKGFWTRVGEFFTHLFPSAKPPTQTPRPGPTPPPRAVQKPRKEKPSPPPPPPAGPPPPPALPPAPAPPSAPAEAGIDPAFQQEISAEIERVRLDVDRAIADLTNQLKDAQQGFEDMVKGIDESRRQFQAQLQREAAERGISADSSVLALKQWNFDREAQMRIDQAQTHLRELANRVNEEIPRIQAQAGLAIQALLARAAQHAARATGAKPPSPAEIRKTAMDWTQGRISQLTAAGIDPATATQIAVTEASQAMGVNPTELYGEVTKGKTPAPTFPGVSSLRGQQMPQQEQAQVRSQYPYRWMTQFAQTYSGPLDQTFFNALGTWLMSTKQKELIQWAQQRGIQVPPEVLAKPQMLQSIATQWILAHPRAVSLIMAEMAGMVQPPPPQAPGKGGVPKGKKKR